MMRSLYSAVSGLKTHQTRMDVIGNNIANVNTEAFKSSSVTFSEIMYQTTSNASAGNMAMGTGGVNAKQIGLGVTTGSTSINITSAGAAETTGNPFDLKLTDSQSTNFFIVSDGTNTMFTRAGSFYVDGNGYLCMSSTGYTLMGWQVDPNTGEVRKDTVSPLQVMSTDNQTSDAEATSKSYISGILDKNDSDVKSDKGYMMNLNIYDNLGYSYAAKFAVKPAKDAAGNAIEGHFMVTLSDVIDGDSKSILSADDKTKNEQLADLFGAADGIEGFEMVFDTDSGKFISIGGQDADGNNIKAQNLNLADVFGENFSNIEVDFSKAINSNNGGTSTLKMNKGDAADGSGTGKKLGALTGITVDTSGVIHGSYDNGNTETLGQIAAARFSNASGLEKVGDNCYQTTLNSGEFD